MRIIMYFRRHVHADYKGNENSEVFYKTCTFRVEGNEN